MERLHGPINPCLFGEEHQDFTSYEQFLNSFNSKEEEEEEEEDARMPILEMLQSGETSDFLPLCELSFQALLSLQQFKKPLDYQIHHTHRLAEQPGPDSRPMEREVMASPRPEKRKRVNRSERPAKKREEAENQRMTHIAVERNRRRQMNEHLAALRSLMPSSYIQRGDQASIIGGAIDFVKELEQVLQSLQSRKRMKKSDVSSDGGGGGDTASSSSAATTGTSTVKCEEAEGNCAAVGISGRSYEFTAERKSETAEVKATVIQDHVNLNVECPRSGGQRQGQVLIKAIVALEDLRLTVLHLNITSLETSAHYSFNLKIEDGCEIRSADGIAVAAHQLFSFINGTT